MKLIPLLLIAICVFLIVRLLLGNRKKPTPNITKNGDSANAGNVVPCSICKLHLPEQEAIKKNSQYFCCTAHLERWEKQQSTK